MSIVWGDGAPGGYVECPRHRLRLWEPGLWGLRRTGWL